MCGTNISFTNLGVKMDPSLKLDQHVNTIVKSLFLLR